jgi:meso-butanediol dehydrogenase / (S,S)-butanediol dehydrogenase / diacetyl reductase
LVNQAGIIWRGPLHEMKLADWVRVQSVNVTGTFLFCRTFVPAMLDNGGGVIINVASGAAFSAGRNLAAYTCSKGAVLALTRALAVDYAPYIRANALCPGLIDTPGSYRFTGGPSTSDLVAARRASAEKVPLARYGTSEEVADAAVFLASDESAFCTGSSLVVDGGKLASS